MLFEWERKRDPIGLPSGSWRSSSYSLPMRRKGLREGSVRHTMICILYTSYVRAVAPESQSILSILAPHLRQSCPRFHSCLWTALDRQVSNNVRARSCSTFNVSKTSVPCFRASSFSFSPLSTLAFPSLCSFSHDSATLLSPIAEEEPFRK